MWIRGAVVLGVLASGGASAADIAARYEAFRAIESGVHERPQIEQQPVVRHAFDQYLGDAYSGRSLANASDQDLALMLQAADTMAFHSNAREDVATLHRVLQVLERRGLASDAERALYFGALVGLRMLDEAKAFRARHPSMDVETVPSVEGERGEGRGPFVFATNADGDALSLRKQPVEAGIQLVVVSLPSCGFSREAMDALARDPALRDALQARTTWLAPVQRQLHTEALRSWNREHPATQVLLADRREDWPFIRNWSTPTFYVLKDGRLVGSFDGWPKGVGRRPQLVALLRAAGLTVE